MSILHENEHFQLLNLENRPCRNEVTCKEQIDKMSNVHIGRCMPDHITDQEVESVTDIEGLDSYTESIGKEGNIKNIES